MPEEITPASVGAEAIPQTPAYPQHHTRVLFHNEPHQHQPRNVNLVHEAEKAASGFNQKLAIGLTKAVGTMICAYIFAVLQSSAIQASMLQQPSGFNGSARHLFNW